VDFSTLQPGQVLVDEALNISLDAADAYQSAVGSDEALFRQHHVLPPMAIAALAMAKALRAVELPSGAVHTGQELEYVLAAPVDVPLRCVVSVGPNSVRRGSRFISLDFHVSHQGDTVVNGRANLAIPEEGNA